MNSGVFIRLINVGIGLCLATGLFALTEPKEPTVKDPESQFVATAPASNARTVMRQTVCTVYPNLTVSGVFKLDFDPVFTFTNTEGSLKSLMKVSLSGISKLEVTEWKPEKISGNYYKFTPCRYNVFANGKQFDYRAHIEIFDAFMLIANSGMQRFYTIYFDEWIESGGGSWKNSKSKIFDNNRFTPMKGVTIRLEMR